MIEGLATSVAAVELRKIGMGELAAALERDFVELREQRDRARDLAVMLEQLCADYELGLPAPENNGTPNNA